MKTDRKLVILGMAAVLGGLLLFVTCSPQKPEPVRTGTIPDGEMDPAKWGQVYPLEYDRWKMTENPKPASASKYKKGFDTDKVIYDKLSQFPYLALLNHGWGFGIEYNEPRGHHYMVIDQLEIDPSRLAGGGVCLSCKTPYAAKLEKELGAEYFKMPYLDAHAKIPVEHQKLGVACIECHDNKTMGLRLYHPAALRSFQFIGVDPSKFTRQELRSAACAQCHVTYIVPKDANMKSAGLFFPWQGSKPGDISIENIIKVIKKDPSVYQSELGTGEWVQKVTGFKVAFIRHPEYEFFTRNSVHSNAGVACADCHMPYIRVGANKISEHDVTSPLKKNMQACQQCHTESPEWLKNQVTAIQDRTVSLMLRSGYATATAAKLFEKVHQAQKDGKTIDQKLYDQAKDLYLEALYRVIFINAENSVGFHNPSEAGRILGDATAMAGKSEALLRQILTQAGVAVPANVNLELDKYLNKRGKKPLNFMPGQEFKDPFGVQEKLTPRPSLGIGVAPAGAATAPPAATPAAPKAPAPAPEAPQATAAPPGAPEK
jgi:nitrite reductase (cytochrome c-552)